MHNAFIPISESANNQKLMIEYEKYQELLSKSQKMQEDYERQLAEMEESKEQALEELTEYYETKLQEKTTLLEQVSMTSQSISSNNWGHAQNKCEILQF